MLRVKGKPDFFGIITIFCGSVICDASAACSVDRSAVPNNGACARSTALVSESEKSRVGCEVKEKETVPAQGRRSTKLIYLWKRTVGVRVHPSESKAATRVAASTPPLKHLDIFQGAPRRLPKPLSDQFPVRVCSCPLCIINRLRSRASVAK